MTHLVHDVPDIVFRLLKMKNIFALFAVLYLVKCLFELDFLCSCEPEMAHHELGFLICPVFIIWIVVCLFESNTPQVIKNELCNKIIYFIIAFFACALFWCSAVFLQGDWWLCVSTKNVTEHQNISCKSESEFTIEEKKIFAKHKNDSFFYGMIIILTALILWCALQLVALYNSRNYDSYCKCCCKEVCQLHYRKFYENALQEATDKHLKAELIKIAEKTADNLCSKYLLIISQDQELLLRNESSFNDIETTWRTISSPDFYAGRDNGEKASSEDESTKTVSVVDRLIDKREMTASGEDSQSDERKENASDGDKLTNKRGKTALGGGSLNTESLSEEDIQSNDRTPLITVDKEHKP